jgi:hypothetical protein
MEGVLFLQWMQQSIHNITDDVENYHLAYVTHEDICRCFEEDTMLAIQAPSGTELEVPSVEQVCLDLGPHDLFCGFVGTLQMLGHYVMTASVPILVNQPFDSASKVLN